MGNAEEDIGLYSLDAEAGPNHSQDQLIVKPTKTWKGYLWDTWDLPKDQRWLLFKLDAFLLTFASVSATPAPDSPFRRKKFKEN
jgi:ACS family pantothenate transporter-like MFS transporter